MKEKLLELIAIQASQNKKDKYKLDFPCILVAYNENDDATYMIKTVSLVQGYKTIPVNILNKTVKFGVILCKTIAQMDLIYISAWLNKKPKNTSKQQRDLFEPSVLFNEYKDMFCEIESFCSYKENEIIISKEEFQKWIHPTYAMKKQVRSTLEKIYNINIPSYRPKLESKDNKIAVEFWEVIKDESTDYNIMSLIKECYLPSEIFENAQPYSDGDWFKIPKDMKLKQTKTYYLKVNGEWAYEFFYALDHLYFYEIPDESIKKLISLQNCNNPEINT